MKVHSETTVEPPHQPLTGDEIQAAFKHPTLRIPNTAGYQLRLVAALLGMLLLQALYCLLVIGVA